MKSAVPFAAILACFIVPFSGDGQEPTARQAVPDEKQQAETLELVRSIFKDDYAKKRPEDRQALAQQLLEHAKDAKTEPVQHFVLLRESQSIAANIGDLALAAKAVQRLCDAFDVDRALEQNEVFGRLLETVRTPGDKKTVIERCLDVAGMLVDADHFDEALRLLGSAERAATTLRDKGLILQARKSKESAVQFEKTYDKVRPYVDLLVKSPDDAKANYIVGRYRCFYQGMWTAGLPLLAKGSSPTLKDLAEATIAASDDEDSQYELAQRWWKISDKLSERERDQVQVFAAEFYRGSLAVVTALKKAIAKKRIGETEELAASLQRRRTINLMQFIDLDSYARPRDKWQMRDGQLICTNGSFVPKVVIPYEPPEEYDFKIVFAQPKLRNEVCMIMPKNGSSFSWEVGGDRGHFKLSIVPPAGGKNPVDFSVKGAQQPGRTHTTIVQVRNAGIRAYYDGRLVAQHETDYRDMKVGSWHDIREKNFLAVGCDDPAIFYAIELTEVRGTGRHVKASP